ncbi:MAG: hypothetical protein AAB271_04650 [Nitrospirota bacterium]|mgnify:CR=1 FL=1
MHYFRSSLALAALLSGSLWIMTGCTPPQEEPVLALVNAPEPDLRKNRLLLLSRIREGLAAVADFSKIEG